MEDKIYFQPIKEGRENYFAEYKPPTHGYPFAILQLTFTNEISHNLIAETMEEESYYWLSRYPFPLMTSSFDASGDFIHLDDVRPESHCILYLDPNSQEIRLFWRLLKSEEFPEQEISRNDLLKTYSEVSYRTSKEVESEVFKHAKNMRAWWYLTFVWAVVAPGAFLVLEFFGPEWLAASVFIYSIYKVTETALKMTGRWKKSKREIEKEKETQLMKHHHYHCQKNPEGFLKLKLENFENENRQKIRKQSEELKKNTSMK